jgi:hypothetical protein
MNIQRICWLVQFNLQDILAGEVVPLFAELWVNQKR